jgi:internalin A
MTMGLTTIGKLQISGLIAGILTLGSGTEAAIACGGLVGGQKVAIQPQNQNQNQNDQRYPNHRSYKTFTDWCLNRDRLSPSAKETVQALLARAETSNCDQANKNLVRVSQLVLRQNYPAIDLSPLQSLPKLTDLSVMGQLTDVSPLQTMTQLTHLRLNEVPVQDISPLRSLTSLTELRLTGTFVSDLKALQSLKKLTTLEVSGSRLRLRCPVPHYLTQVTDLSPLSSLTQLTYLDLSQNKIQNLAPLSSLTQLTYLDLSHNKVRDLAALKALTHLSVLKLGGNSIWGKTCPLQPASICQF